MHSRWIYILISLPYSQAISLQIDGTVNLGKRLPNLRAHKGNSTSSDLKKIGLKMLDIIINNNKLADIGSIIKPDEETTRKKHKHSRLKSIPNAMHYTVMDREQDAKIDFEKHHKVKKGGHELKSETTDFRITEDIKPEKGSEISKATEKHRLEPILSEDVVSKKIKTSKATKNKTKAIHTKSTKIEVTHTTEENKELTRAGKSQEHWNATPELEKTLYIEPHKVKQVDKIKNVTDHIHAESIRVLDNMKELVTDYRLKKEIERLKRNYEDKFGEFLKETEEQNIRTRLGHQKVVLHVVDTSDGIMKRLINRLMKKFDANGILRNQDPSNKLKEELSKKKASDNQHLCKELKICRSDTSFPNFMINVINIILSTDDNKVKVIGDALSEVLKVTDFSHVLSVKAEEKLQRGVSYIEKLNADVLRAVFAIFKNILSNRNAPIKVIGKLDPRVNKTLAMLEIIDMWDKKLPPTDQNRLQWQDLTNSFHEWKDNKRVDNNDLVQSFVDQIMKAVNGFNQDEKRAFNNNVNIITS